MINIKCSKVILILYSFLFYCSFYSYSDPGLIHSNPQSPRSQDLFFNEDDCLIESILNEKLKNLIIDKKKEELIIYEGDQKLLDAELSSQGILGFYIQTKDEKKGRSFIPGRYLYHQMMTYFQGKINIIEGYWTFGENLKKMNELTADSSISLESAIFQTWSGMQAFSYGYTEIELKKMEGRRGHYKRIIVHFLKPKNGPIKKLR